MTEHRNFGDLTETVESISTAHVVTALGGLVRHNFKVHCAKYNYSKAKMAAVWGMA